MAEDKARRLSMILWEARELCEMLSDMVEARASGIAAAYPRRVVAEIDAYRAEQGWSPNGFGGEM